MFRGRRFEALAWLKSVRAGPRNEGGQLNKLFASSSPRSSGSGSGNKSVCVALGQLNYCPKVR